MAAVIAQSGLFGVKNPTQALALMLLAQAEGMHPATAARDYHVIQGRPTLKADTMLARFQAAGGSVEWHDYTDKVVSATFSHPRGGKVQVAWTLETAKEAELAGKDMWKKFPAPCFVPESSARDSDGLSGVLLACTHQKKRGICRT